MYAAGGAFGFEEREARTLFSRFGAGKLRASYECFGSVNASLVAYESAAVQHVFTARARLDFARRTRCGETASDSGQMSTKSSSIAQLEATSSSIPSSTGLLCPS